MRDLTRVLILSPVRDDAAHIELVARSTDWRNFTHIRKLDGDIELPDDCFALLLAEFEANPSLGIGGGTLVELGRVGLAHGESARQHIRRELMLYRRECFAALGGPGTESMRHARGCAGI